MVDRSHGPIVVREGFDITHSVVGLVEDALVGYDELNVGLDLVLAEQAETGNPESHGGAMLPFTEDLQQIVRKTPPQRRSTQPLPRR